MKPTTVVITGTDTEVGKTWVGAALARASAQAGWTTVAIKPVESGCSPMPSPGEDGALLAEATGQQAPRQALTRLALPVAPPVAADVAGVTLDADAWLAQVHRYTREAAVVWVEGAGGLLSPLTWTMTALDLALALEAMVVVVSANRLGTLNHTLLTLEVLRAHHLHVAGVVLNQTTPLDRTADASRPSNAASLARIAPAVQLLQTPHVDHWDALVPVVAPVLDWLER
ncbi:MAG: dethiobiotin synthase [Myxococcota bacterium]